MYRSPRPAGNIVGDSVSDDWNTFRISSRTSFFAMDSKNSAEARLVVSIE